MDENVKNGLLSDASLIESANTEGYNTAHRIGKMFIDIINQLGEKDFGILTTESTEEPSDENVFSALRSLAQFISKTGDDRTPFGLSIGGKLTVEELLQFGTEFIEGLLGKGGKIDKNGNAYLRNLVLYESLEVPLLRYNRTEISIGNDWGAPGGGEIESVVVDVDPDTGEELNTGTITLHLEEGEVGAVSEDDICMGIFHDSVNTDNNEYFDTDDSRGNFTFAGFYTCYFRVTEIIEDGDNSKFRYVLRPVSERWTSTKHPAANMTFVAYGNFDSTNKSDRQNSRYDTRTYKRYLKGVNNWEIDSNNIAAQFGDLSNLTVHGLDMTGYSAYLNNIYMTGTIHQYNDNPLYMTIDIDNDNYIAYGETKNVRCSVFRGFEDLTSQVTKWTVTRDSGSPQDDAAWALKDKVKNFNGEIDLCFTADENDIGNNSYSISTIFTFVAEIDDSTEATYTLEI